MQYQILYSKIEIPELQKNLIIRERLLKVLNSLSEKMIILYGTVGYGKTVLISHYIQLYEMPCAWYHLDDMDNDLCTFFKYLSASFKQVWNDFEFNPSEYFTSENEAMTYYQLSMHFILYLNEFLNRSQNDRYKLALVLDDFQVIKNEDIFSFIDLLMEYSSSRLKIFLATKSSLPGFAAAFMLREKAHVLGTEVLAFTQQEVVHVLEKITHQDIDDIVAKNVYKKVEGWPAETMFVAQYFKQLGYVQKDLDWNIISDESLIKHYIMNELFKKLPYDIQQFLVRTCVLDEISVGLCNSVLQIHNARSTLNYLLQENLFILRINRGSGNYRYHSLFQLFLQKYILPEQKKETLERAADYYMRRGNIDRAIEYYIQCDSYKKVEQYFIEYGMTLLHQKQFQTLNRYMEYLEHPSGMYAISPAYKDVAQQIYSFLNKQKEHVETAVPQVYIQYFGTFKVYLGKEHYEMAWRTKKATELFAYLSLMHGKPVKRNDLLKKLWPEDYPNNAVAMLHNMLYNIRKELSPFHMSDLIQYVNREYTMNMEWISSDLSSIQELCQAIERKDINLLVKNKERFFTYWGAYLDGIENTWCSLEKYYYEKCFFNGCDLLGTYLAKQEMWADAAQVLKAGLEVDTYSEIIAQKLMGCYAKLQDKKEGKKLYNYVCQLYKSELGIQPGQAFINAYKECIHGCA